jgi:hypothetical protein
VAGYGLGDRGSIPDKGREFFRPAGSGAHPAACTVGTGGSFPGGKARPGRDAGHSPTPTTEVKKQTGYTTPPPPPNEQPSIVNFIFHMHQLA